MQSRLLVTVLGLTFIAIACALPPESEARTVQDKYCSYSLKTTSKNSIIVFAAAAKCSLKSNNDRISVCVGPNYLAPTQAYTSDPNSACSINSRASYAIKCRPGVRQRIYASAIIIEKKYQHKGIAFSEDITCKK